MPDIDRVNNTFTTLSAGAIVLTFTALQIWTTKGFVKEYYLVISWLGFGLGVFIGAIQGIGLYVHKAHYLRMVSAFEDVEKSQSAMKPDLDELKNHLARLGFLDRLLFTLISAQPMVFFASIVYLVMFAVKNYLS